MFVFLVRHCRTKNYSREHYEHLFVFIISQQFPFVNPVFRISVVIFPFILQNGFLSYIM